MLPLRVLLVVWLLPAVSAASDGVWVPDPPPTKRYGATAVYDSQRDRLVVFGDLADAQTWVLPQGPGGKWELLATTGTPPALPYFLHSAIYDPVRDRMIVYGGNADRTDLFALDFDPTPTWAALTPAGTPPPGRDGASVIYDPIGDRMIVHGGSGLNDTWELDLAGATTWTQLAPTGTPPAGGERASAIYDPVRTRMVLFGGGSWFTPTDEVWELALGSPPAWAQITPAGTSPAARGGHAAAYDPAGDRLVVFGGEPGFLVYDDETWELTFSGTPTWTQLAPAGPGPSARARCGVAWDSSRNKLVLFGGAEDGGNDNEVWALDLVSESWGELGAVATPAARAQGGSVYDALRNRMLVIGGQDTASVNDVWAYDLAGSGGWQELTVSGTPPSPRAGHSTVLDPGADRVLLFGGNGNDVWELSLAGTPTWSEIIPSGTPPVARSNHGAVFDASGNRMLILGGAQTGNVDVWELSLASTPTWVEWTVGGGAPAQRYAPGVYLDTARDRVLMFGGSAWSGIDSRDVYNDLWELNLSGPPVWSAIGQGGTVPSARSYPTLAHDPARDRLVLFGGGADGFAFGYGRQDTHALDLATLSWTELSVGAELPRARLGQHAVLDPVGDGLVVFGGFLHGIGYLGDTWVLQFPSTVGTETPELTPARLTAAPNPFHSRVALRFTLEERSPVTITIYDVRGRQVRGLVRESPGEAGENEFIWDGTTDRGATAPTGLYFVRAVVEERRFSQKLLKLR